MLADVRHAFRLLLKSPGFTVTAVLTLAIAISANSLVFSLIQTILLRPVNLPGSEQLAVVWQANTQKGWQKYDVASGNYFDWKRDSRSFNGLAILNPYVSATLTGRGYPEQLEGAAVSADFFSVLRAEPLLGRAFVPGEDEPGRSHVVVLSHKLWSTRFASDHTILNRSITLNNVPHLVVGVMPETFPIRAVTPDYGISRREPVYWTPLVFDAAQRTFRQYGDFRVIARLQDGITLIQAQDDLRATMRRLAGQFPQTNRGWSVQLVPLTEQTAGDSARVFVLLAIAVAIVLLAACANIAGMLLARSLSRQKETAVRLALGASRMRIVRQFLAESLLLSMLGGAAGLLLTHWLVLAVVNTRLFDVPRREELGIDAAATAFLMAISVLVGLLSGVLPALGAHLQAGSRGVTAARRPRFYQDLLVVAEVSLSFLLLIGAALLLNSLVRLRAVDPGFRTKDLLTFQVTLPLQEYREAPARIAFFRRTVERFRQLPGVASVGASSSLPFMRVSDQAVVPFRVEGELPDPERGNLASARAITPAYFETMGIGLHAGRPFSERDTDTASPVIIVNAAFAQRVWSRSEPLGRMVSVESGSDGKPLWRKVVGVAANVRSFGLEVEEQPGFYIPYSQFATPWLVFALRTREDSAGVLAAVREELVSLDPSRPLSKVSTMVEMIEAHLRPRMASLALAGILASIAVVLASLGLYALLAFQVGRRWQEFGIRLAVGARISDILKLVLGRGTVLAAIGILTGVVLAAAASRTLTGWLYGVATTDPLTYAAVALCVFALSLVASWLPARRASRVDPINVLRHE